MSTNPTFEEYYKEYKKQYESQEEQGRLLKGRANLNDPESLKQYFDQLKEEQLRRNAKMNYLLANTASQELKAQRKKEMEKESALNKAYREMVKELDA